MKRQTNLPAEDTGKTKFLKRFLHLASALAKHSRILCLEEIRCGAIISPVQNKNSKYENE
jgi:hypothetical protein